MKSAEKERLIKSDILIIESQVRHAFNQGYDLGYKEGIKKNKKQPKTGHWINVNEGKWNTIPAYKCSACGANADLRDWSGESPFCPWCGAKMVEPQERSGEE